MGTHSPEEGEEEEEEAAAAIQSCLDNLTAMNNEEITQYS